MSAWGEHSLYGAGNQAEVEKQRNVLEMMGGGAQNSLECWNAVFVRAELVILALGCLGAEAVDYS
jgi:hypothetical protein